MAIANIIEKIVFVKNQLASDRITHYSLQQHACGRLKRHLARNLLAGGSPTRFEATLVQSGNTLIGNILDDNFLGEAKVSGEIIGRSIRFIKSYLTISTDSVVYTGTLAESEDFIQGQWFIAGFDSGPWEARRGGEELMSSWRSRLADQIPLGTR